MGAAILNNYENTWLNLHPNEIITDRFSKNVIFFLEVGMGLEPGTVWLWSNLTNH